jgi:hypothetical protein
VAIGRCLIGISFHENIFLLISSKIEAKLDHGTALFATHDGGTMEDRAGTLVLIWEETNREKLFVTATVSSRNRAGLTCPWAHHLNMGC